jgi:peptide/nickel transport system substrate-binding protein
MGTLTETRGLDPIVSGGSGTAGGTELTALYDTLMRFDPDTGEYLPQLAESLEPNADATQWVLHLRPDVHFGDGTPLDAAAVKFSVERHVGTLSPSADMAATIRGIEVVDPLTVRFDLDAPWGGFPYLLAEEGGMVVSPTTVKAKGDAAFNKDPTGGGAGPFELERWAPGEELVLKARPDYWGGPVCLDRLRFVTIPGSKGTYEAFQRDELQVAFLRDAAVVHDARQDGVEGYTNVASSGSVLLLNNGSADRPTSDVRVRRAIAAAMDLDLINQRTNNGEGLASSALVWPELDLAPDVPGPAYDPDLARSLVQQVKAEGAWDGSLELVCSNTPVAVDFGIAFKALLDAVGFQVTVTNDAKSTERILAKDYDAGCWGLAVFTSSPWSQLSQYRSGGARNRTGFADPAMDRALDQLRAAGTNDELRAALGEVQRVWDDTVPTIVYESVQEMIATAPAVHDVAPTRDTVVMFQDAWLDR